MYKLTTALACIVGHEHPFSLVSRLPNSGLFIATKLLRFPKAQVPSHGHLKTGILRKK